MSTPARCRLPANDHRPGSSRGELWLIEAIARARGGSLRAAAVAVIVGAMVVLAGGCSPDEKSETLTNSGASRHTPVDFVAPGELAEGPDSAFGLRLPRDMGVTSRGSDVVYAPGRIPFEHVSNYVRDRVDAVQVNIGPTRTVFRSANVRGGDPVELEIEVVVVRKGVQMVVHNRTRKPAEPGLSDGERWRRAGLNPDGKVTKDQSQ